MDRILVEMLDNNFVVKGMIMTLQEEVQAGIDSVKAGLALIKQDVANIAAAIANETDATAAVELAKNGLNEIATSLGNFDSQIDAVVPASAPADTTPADPTPADAPPADTTPVQP